MSWALSSFALLALAVAIGLAWYERERPSSRVLALVAALAALAVVGRLAFAAIPNVKPTTDIVLFGGYALGAAPGFAVGAITALVSNVFLSQGPWTVWQMAGWGAVGVGGALLARTMRGREPGRLQLAAVCGLAGFAFGAWMDLYQWTLAARQDLDSYLAVAASSLPYNLAHAIGNVAFSLLIGPAFIRALARYRRRFEVSWPAPAGVTAAMVAALILGLAAAPALAAGGSPAAKAERYLRSAQNRDGGFGTAADGESSTLYSGWAALGLAGSGTNPRDVSRHGRSLAAYVARAGRSEREIGEVERTVMVLRAAGLSPRRFGGRNLVREIRARAPRRRLDRGLCELHRLRDPGAQVGRRERGRRHDRLARRVAERRRRLRRRPLHAERHRHDRRHPAGARGHRTRPRRVRSTRGGLPAPPAEPRRWFPPAGRPRLQLAVHGLCRAGPPGRARGRRRRRAGRSPTCGAASRATGAWRTPRRAPRRRCGSRPRR